MSSFFASPPKPQPTPALKPVRNTALEAQIAAQNRRMGAAGTVLTDQSRVAGAGGRTAPQTGANTLTGN